MTEFDGQNHGAGPLLTPYPHHPYSPAVGAAAAYALTAGYMFSRTNARLIGIQTYMRRHLDQQGDVTHIQENTYQSIARFRAIIPAHATHVGAVCLFGGLRAGINSIVNHRITVVDGLDSDQDTTSEEVETPTIRLPGFGDYPRFTLYDDVIHRSTVFVERDDTKTTTAIQTVTVEARAEDRDGNTRPYRPDQIVCWWESYG